MHDRRHLSPHPLPIVMTLIAMLACAGCDSKGDSPANHPAQDAGGTEAGHGGGGSGGSPAQGGTGGGADAGTAGTTGQSGFGTVRLTFRVQ